jgi:hypothetical protein
MRDKVKDSQVLLSWTGPIGSEMWLSSQVLASRLGVIARVRRALDNSVMWPVQDLVVDAVCARIE